MVMIIFARLGVDCVLAQQMRARCETRLHGNRPACNLRASLASCMPKYSSLVGIGIATHDQTEDAEMAMCGMCTQSSSPTHSTCSGG